MKRHSFPGILAILAWLALPGVLSAAQPVLSITNVSAAAVMLQLTGDAGMAYQLEGSTNFADWFSVGSGTAQGGLLSVTHDGPAKWPWTFYRGLQSGSAQYYPSVGVELDTNLVAEGVLLPSEPGAVTLVSPDGVVYTLVSPTNALTDALPVTMTLVTNLTGVPAAHGFLTAVQLEPEGVVFAAPLFLRIDFPTNLPSAQISSYAFANDGAALHLQPDLVSSNSVRIFVYQLGGFGCGVFTLPELESLAATVPPPAPGKDFKATLDDCFPENVREANALHAELTRKARPIQQRSAANLGRARQSALLGLEEPGNPAVLEAFRDAADFVQAELIPRIPNAQTKLRVGQELMRWLLSFERQSQLLGAGGDSWTGVILPFACVLMQEGEREIAECCRTHGADTRLVTDLLSLERQRQLLGVDTGACGSGDFESILETCLPQWYGTLTLTESGSRATNRLDTQAHTLDTVNESYTYQVTMVVLTALETVSPPIPMVGFPGMTNLNIHLGGTGTGAHQLNERHKDLWEPCKSALAPKQGSPHPKDGGDTVDRLTVRGSKTTNWVEVDVFVNISTEGSPFPLPPTGMSFNLPETDVAERGQTTSTWRGLSAAGCGTATTVTLTGVHDRYGGGNYKLAEGEFGHSTNQMYFNIATNRTLDELTVRRTLTLDLRRRN